MKKTPIPIPPKRRIVLRVNVCMAERGIRSVAALHRLLIADGVDISHSQLTRVVNNSAMHLSVPLLDALINILGCPASDLFGEKDTI